MTPGSVFRQSVSEIPLGRKFHVTGRGPRILVKLAFFQNLLKNSDTLKDKDGYAILR
jgi:hypothetical protein